ncbi:MAG: hypothetical protein AB7G80_00465 [Dongiaceae bacterium]
MGPGTQDLLPEDYAEIDESRQRLEQILADPKIRPQIQLMAQMWDKALSLPYDKFAGFAAKNIQNIQDLANIFSRTLNLHRKSLIEFDHQTSKWQGSFDEDNNTVRLSLREIYKNGSFLGLVSTLRHELAHVRDGYRQRDYMRHRSEKQKKALQHSEKVRNFYHTFKFFKSLFTKAGIAISLIAIAAMGIASSVVAMPVVIIGAICCGAGLIFSHRLHDRFYYGSYEERRARLAEQKEILAFSSPFRRCLEEANIDTRQARQYIQHVPARGNFPHISGQRQRRLNKLAKKTVRQIER